jgi:ABC-type glutathione transport system ATPase component
MAEVNEDKPSKDIHDHDPVIEKTQSQQLHVSSTSGTPSDQESDGNDEHRLSEDALGELIPQLTRRGTINPDSPAFSTEKFLREMLTRAEQQGLHRRNAGVVFRGLVVLGYGSDYTHQKTVGTMATGIARIAQNIRARRHPPMKTILYSMDGVVTEGEMLLVLGKPGSGATTLLKTIAGETRSYASVSGGLFSPICLPFLTA